MLRKGWFLAAWLLLAGLFLVGGAAPAQADNFIHVTTTNDLIALDQFCSLREAIIAANTNAGGIIVGECPAGSATETDVIQLQAGVTYPLSLAGNNEDAAQTGDLDVLNNAMPDVDVRIVALGTGTAVVENQGMNDRLWQIHGAGFALEGVETRGGTAAVGGGLHNNNGQVTLQDAIFALNTASSGGAISSSGANADLRLTRVEVTRNIASNPGTGGGIYNSTGLLVIIDSNISGNMAMDDGGGLLNQNASATLTRTRIAGNLSGGCGGGIHNAGSAAMTLIDSQVTGQNDADGPGGGLCNLATLSVTQGSVVSTNEANAGGGGIYNAGSLTLRSSLLHDNKALDADTDGDGLGGGLYGVAGSTATVTQSAIVENDAATSGGGVAMDGTLMAFNSTISDNFGGTTGGLFVMAAGEATLVNVTMADNAALLPLTGTGLHVLSGDIVLGNSIVASTVQP
ncbi:MAG: hypothetical protein KC425_14770, partial [Anaerolineales bacterium]|nr:hypothetical protein [Anaerolineales bacterium]